MATAVATTAPAGTGNLTRWLVLLLGAAVFLNYVDRGAIAVAAPVMKGELGMSATAFGIAVSAFFWVYAPVQLLVGWLCDRFSVTKLSRARLAPGWTYRMRSAICRVYSGRSSPAS